jgi:uncharacterized protein
MKFQPEQADGFNLITRYESGKLWVLNQPHETHVLVPWRGLVQAWNGAPNQALDRSHFEQTLSLNPELVIFGSGSRLKFPPMAVLQPLYEARVGVETMDTAAACRTFNVLASEGRRVVAALLVAG